MILPPGCQVDVELSSTVLLDWVDKFALNRFMDGAPVGAQTGTQNANGARPAPAAELAADPGSATRCGSPSTRHAARRGWSASPPKRSPGWCRRTTRRGDFTYPSTGSVDVAARWQEWGDGPDPTDATALVAQLSLLRGSTSLPQIRHDFGDTKHRMVTFRLTAVSRFRDRFDPKTGRQLFRLDGDLDEVSVLSTARPRPPAVLSVVPAFAVAGGAG